MAKDVISTAPLGAIIWMDREVMVYFAHVTVLLMCVRRMNSFAELEVLSSLTNPHNFDGFF